MDLRQLEYFIYVAELGSFTQAAIVLGVGQPALSRQVRRLEVELRQTLFYRNGRGVSLTEAGKRLLAHGRTIQMQFEHARHDVEDARGTPLGRVTIGLPYAVGRLVSVPFVKAFRERFPLAQLSITEGLTIHLHEWLLSGRVDIALLHDPTPSPSVDIVPVINDELLLIGLRKNGGRAAGSGVGGRKGRGSSGGSAGVAGNGEGPGMGPDIPLRKVAELPLIIPSRPHSLRMIVETKFANMGLKPNIALEIDGVATIINLVAQSEGYAIATSRPVVISPFRDRLLMRRIVGPRMSSVVAMATSAERPLTTLVHRTRDLLRELLAEVIS